MTQRRLTVEGGAAALGGVAEVDTPVRREALFHLTAHVVGEDLFASGLEAWRV